MYFVSDPALWKMYFELETVGGLRHFRSKLDQSVPEQAALSYYISTWTFYETAENTDPFVPGNSLSPDRSAVMYGSAPVIFEGSNHWAWKPYLSMDTVRDRLLSLYNLVAAIRRSNKSAKIVLVIVPEKDHVISSFFLKEERFHLLEEAFDSFKRNVALHDIGVIFDQPFRGIDKFQNLDEFDHPDSHLAGRNYANIFAFTLSSLEVESRELDAFITLKKLPSFGDLASKFCTPHTVPNFTYQPDFEVNSSLLVTGNDTFGSPLGETRQGFHNESAQIDQSVCLLGDSHTSIYSQRKLNYLFANSFRETYFEWNPCGIRETPDHLPYDNIVLESSSRFVV